MLSENQNPLMSAWQTRPYIENMADGGAVQEIGLKILNRYMEKLDETIVALQGNLRVCEAALKFYREELLQDRKLKARNLAWMMDEDSRTRIEEDLEDFQEKMKWVCTSTQEMLRRVGILKEVGARRENTASSFSFSFPLFKYCRQKTSNVSNQVGLACPLNRSSGCSKTATSQPRESSRE